MIPQRRYPVKTYREIVDSIENQKPQKSGAEIIIETIKGAGLKA